MDVRPFQIYVEEKQLEDPQRRLMHIRWPQSLDAEGWDDGSSLAFTQRLMGY